MNRLIILLILISTYINAQSLEIGFDPKIAIVGTDNQYTKHDQIANVHIKFSVIDENRTYLGLGFNWTNLQEYYTGLFGFIGRQYPIVEKVSILPNIQIGFIWRERHSAFENDPRSKHTTSVSGALNLPLRYQLTDWFAIQGTVQLAHATDTEGRLFRHSGFIHLIIKV